MKKIALIALLTCGLLAGCNCNNSGCKKASTGGAQGTNETSRALPDVSQLKETKFTTEQLLGWRFTGKGEFYNESKRQVCLQESNDSQGVGIFAPQIYEGDVVLRYKIMALNAATVLVNLLCVSEAGESLDMLLPADYDGSMGPILTKENYFFAFRNSPHATAPFINKNPGFSQMVIAEKDEMLPGVYYDLEAGRVGSLLWLKVDGKTILSYEDPQVLAGGYLGIRIRGLVGHPAACVIREVSILSVQ